VSDERTKFSPGHSVAMGTRAPGHSVAMGTRAPGHSVASSFRLLHIYCIINCIVISIVINYMSNSISFCLNSKFSLFIFYDSDKFIELLMTAMCNEITNRRLRCILLKIVRRVFYCVRRGEQRRYRGAGGG
jgi:hypothetical protein